MKKVVIYPTPEVRELLDLLAPDAVIERHGESGNVAVSLPPTPEEIEECIGHGLLHPSQVNAYLNGVAYGNYTAGEIRRSVIAAVVSLRRM